MVKKNIQKKIPSFMSDKIEANSLSVNGDDAQLKRTRSKISNISFNSDGKTNEILNKPHLTRNSSTKE